MLVKFPPLLTYSLYKKIRPVVCSFLLQPCSFMEKTLLHGHNKLITILKCLVHLEALIESVAEM